MSKQNIGRKPFIPEHAQDRMRQRFGLKTIHEMQTWVMMKINKGKLDRVQPDGRHVYVHEFVEVVWSKEDNRIVTVLDVSTLKQYEALFGGMFLKDVRKVLSVKERVFRKAEINVAEITLNMLKCRNPKIKARLNEKLTIANDDKENLLTEITVIRKAAKHYGVEV
jgi:hypothetical protein